MGAINDVGLLAEEVDLGSGEMIGNFPQAFSHIGLINAAWAIAQAQAQRTALQWPGRRLYGGAVTTTPSRSERILIDAPGSGWVWASPPGGSQRPGSVRK